MLRLAIAALCLAIPAQAQNYDYEYNGATVHRHILSGAQCFHIGTAPTGFDWEHNGPCGPDDFAWLDQASMEPQHLNFREGLTKPQLERALSLWLFTKFTDWRLRDQIKVSTCMSLPTGHGGNPWWWHAPPCKPDDIGQITSAMRITFRKSVTIDQLHYAIAVALDTLGSPPIALEEFPEWRGP
jgi:hypothetical protein